jgi:hypothetical protein
MKPCPEFEESVASLVLGVLDTLSALETRDHLNTCPGCSHYYRQITGADTGANATEAPWDIQHVPRHRFNFQLGNE